MFSGKDPAKPWGLPKLPPPTPRPTSVKKRAVVGGTRLAMACRESAVQMTLLKFMWLQKFSVDSGAANRYENSEGGLVLLLKSNG